MTKNGIACRNSRMIINLDPKSSVENNINFVSHAHIDHLPSGKNGIILATKETKEIANIRGRELANHVEYLDDFALYDSGHILGARSLLFDDVFYTGDICTRDRGFLKAATIPKCKTLITECTFGKPEFVFPKLEETIKKVNELISELYNKGKPVLLLGYQLGKAQTLSHLFGHWEPVYYHDSVKEMNDLHRKLGVQIKPGLGHTEATSKGLLEKKPWIMVAPLMSESNQFVKDMKSKYGAVTVGFSGWAKSSFSYGRKNDYSIPLSDHCDYGELIDLVKRTGAEKIYTVHGFVDEFAADLVKMGFDAQPLRENSLDEFL
ncbi:MAG: exonuclease [Candidatus Nitrosotenuis sp.]|nr:MAG: exonuclease [Candidatus Nitrosotenuis sp.]